MNSLLAVLLASKVCPTPSPPPPPPFSTACSQRYCSLMHHAEQPVVYRGGLARLWCIQAASMKFCCCWYCSCSKCAPHPGHHTSATFLTPAVLVIVSCIVPSGQLRAVEAGMHDTQKACITSWLLVLLLNDVRPTPRQPHTHCSIAHCTVIVLC